MTHNSTALDSGDWEANHLERYLGTVWYLAQENGRERKEFSDSERRPPLLMLFTHHII